MNFAEDMAHPSMAVVHGLAFPDFLAIKSEEQTKNFYQLCSNIVLDKQVGIVDILYQHPMHYNN